MSWKGSCTARSNLNKFEYLWRVCIWGIAQRAPELGSCVVGTPLCTDRLTDTHAWKDYLLLSVDRWWVFPQIENMFRSSSQSSIIGGIRLKIFRNICLLNITEILENLKPDTCASDSWFPIGIKFIVIENSSWLLSIKIALSPSCLLQIRDKVKFESVRVRHN